MKGVILCGGTGSRLKPLTDAVNKHLLPVYSKPMIYYPIQTMVDSGIRDIMLVCGGNDAGEFLRVIGNGSQFGLKHVSYTYQSEPRGIADALGLCEEWANKEPVCVMLGDNIFEHPFPDQVVEFASNPKGAFIFLTKVLRPYLYGVVEVNDIGDVLSIVEKPKEPKSSLVAVGLYMYDSGVWDFIRSLVPSARNELEITDLNNRYLQNGILQAKLIRGWWVDCGESIEGYMQSCITVYKDSNYRCFYESMKKPYVV